MRAGDRLQAHACTLCAGTERRVLATRGRGLTPLTTVICHGCGLVSHHPLPGAAEVAAFYASLYRLRYKGSREPKPKHVVRALRGAISRARRHATLLPPGAPVLDVGASSGEFTYVMTRCGFAAEGVEPNPDYAAFARRTYGVALHTGGLEGFAVPDGRYALVTLNHVLEHLVDPAAALRRIHGWLAGDGLLLLEVPNLAGVRKQAINTFHTAHIWNFTPQTLARLAWQAGFARLPGEERNGTSIVLRKRRPEDAPPAGTGPALAEAIARQLATEQSSLAYLLSGSPFTRRWNRLRRSAEEILILRRHPGLREAADALIEGSGVLQLARRPPPPVPGVSRGQMPRGPGRTAAPAPLELSKAG